MSKLSIRNFSSGEGEEGGALDFSHLETNPNFAGNQGGNEGAGQEGAGQEGAEGAGQEGAQEGAGQEGASEGGAEGGSQKGAEGAGQEGSGQEGSGQEGAGQEGAEGGQEGTQGGAQADKGSLNNDDLQGQQQLEIDEAGALNFLSEKLGREIKLEDLTPVEIDPQVRAINDWLQETGRPIEDFFKFQKDYSQVSDLDIARETLQLKYPTLNKEEIELEMKRFIPSEDDLENEVAIKNLELKKFATEGRTLLNGLKADLGKPSDTRYPDDVRQKIKFAEEVQQQMETNKQSGAQYAQGIAKASSEITSVKMNLSDDLTIDFNLSETERKELPELIDTMPHWRNADGSWNHQAVVKDAAIIKHYDRMLKLAYEQGVSAGKEEVVKGAGNSNLDGRSSMGEGQDGGSKKPKIEGLDNILGNRQISIRSFSR